MKKWYIVSEDNKGDAIIFDEIENIKMIHEGGPYWCRSAGKETKEELILHNKILNDPCVCCGGVITTTYHNNKSLIEKNMCFSCDLWDERSRIENKVVIDGCCYSIGLETNQENKYKGYGGRKFKIQMNNSDEIITTTNLWCGGDVPLIFRDRIKDNAKFVD